VAPGGVLCNRQRVRGGELKRQRAEYAGPCLSEHVVEDHMPSPEMQLEFSEEVSMAFLAVLERLGPRKGPHSCCMTYSTTTITKWEGCLTRPSQLAAR
jgi:hypothetical protein